MGDRYQSGHTSSKRYRVGICTCGSDNENAGGLGHSNRGMKRREISKQLERVSRFKALFNSACFGWVRVAQSDQAWI